METATLLLSGQGNPAISLTHIGLRLLLEREQAATRRAQALAAQEFEPGELKKDADWFGRGILWHDAFPQGLRLLVCDTPLYRLTALLSFDLPSMNNGPLDYYDYGYVADVLRELLADCQTWQEELALSRALAWVVWEGEKLGE